MPELRDPQMIEKMRELLLDAVLREANASTYFPLANQSVELQNSLMIVTMGTDPGRTDEHFDPGVPEYLQQRIMDAAVHAYVTAYRGNMHDMTLPKIASDFWYIFSLGRLYETNLRYVFPPRFPRTPKES